MKKKLGIYYISLEKDVHRRNSLKAQFKNNFDSMKYIQAVYGKDLKVEDYFERIVENHNYTGRLLSPGEIGCLMSHEIALKTFLKSDNDYALILEDDIIGDDKDIEKIEQFLSKMTDNCFIHCGGMDGRNSAQYIYGKKNKSNKDLLELSKFSFRHLWRACCYLVDKKTANVLLKIYESNMVVADEWNKILNKLDSKIYAANILHHPIELIDSNLENERLQSSVEKSISFYTKKIKNKIFNICNVFLLKILGYSKLFK